MFKKNLLFIEPKDCSIWPLFHSKYKKIKDKKMMITLCQTL
jgi:hypothetical protein